MDATSLKAVSVIGGSSRHGRTPVHIDAAHELGSLLCDCGYQVVCSGGRNGLVGAMLDGYGASGLKATAIALSGSTELEEMHSAVSEIRPVNSTAERKRLFRDLSSGIIALPGGVGTLEEIFSFAFEKRQGLLFQPVIILDVDAYFLPLKQMMDGALRHGFLGLRAKPDLLGFATCAADALVLLKEAEKLLSSKASRS
jgi:uncharacterized protein (TIGR00730 family)